MRVRVRVRVRAGPPLLRHATLATIGAACRSAAAPTTSPTPNVCRGAPGSRAWTEPKWPLATTQQPSLSSPSRATSSPAATCLGLGSG